MASTITLSGDWLVNLGNRNQTYGTGNLGASYATGGIAVTPTQVGLGAIDSLVIDPAGGYVFQYVPSTGKVKAFVEGSSLPNVLVTGGQGAGAGLQILPDTAAGVLGKTAATNRSIPGATFGLVAAPAPSAEVAATTDLSGTTFTFRSIGR